MNDSRKRFDKEFGKAETAEDRMLLEHCWQGWSARDSEVERLREALKQIRDLTKRPFDGFPPDWEAQIAACPECRRYKDHPIQQGICDKHRQPLWARERHAEHEARAIGFRAQDIAHTALSSQDKESA